MENPSDGAPNESLEAGLEEALAELLGAGAAGAVALAVGPWGRVRSVAGLDSSGLPLRGTVQFDVGSVTKTFVAALVLALVEEGTAWGHVGLGHVTTVAFTRPDASRQVVLMANALLTSDAAWAALNRATWAVLCARRTDGISVER